MGFTIDNSEGMQFYRVVTTISALKLEEKGIRMSAKLPKLRKPMAKFLGLKANATYADVIKGMEAYKAKLVKDAADKGIVLVK